MIRPVFTEVALFLAPFALYAIYLAATRSGVLDAAHWSWSRIAWLVMAAFVLMAGSFVVLAHFSGSPPGSIYTPAHVDNNGQFVPGQTR
jgi:hypothetical protein